MTGAESLGPRRMERGGWFWIDKAIIQRYGCEIGPVGIAVYNCLASYANAEQTCFPSQDRMSRMLGCSRATVNRAIKNLESVGLIALERRGRYPQTYRLLHVRCNSNDALLSTSDTHDVTPERTNNNKLPRISKNNGAVAGPVIHNGLGISQGQAHSEPNKLQPKDIAEALGDERNLQAYVACCRDYSQSILRRALAEATEMPEEKIRKSRAALFRHLVKAYERESTHNPGH